jgi:DNA-binding NarL/FixJ family response regulator
MPPQKNLLVLANKSNLLYCTAVAEALSQREMFAVDLIEHPSNEIAIDSCLPHCDIALCFGPGSIFRLHKLRKTGAKLLLVMDAHEKLTLRHLLALGVDGAITSEASYEELLTAIDTLAVRKLKYISPFIVSFTEGPAPDSWASLSEKERYIALGLTEGKRNVEMATDLNISPKTVNTYKSRLYRKLGVSNDMQLLKLTLHQLAANNAQ